MTSSTAARTPWLINDEHTDQDRPTRLVVLPYAGGGASIYRGWQAMLPDVDVVPVQLPGREERFEEPAIPSVEPIVGAVADALNPVLDRPYAIFGHSMGARIAFELTRELRRRGRRAPSVLFVSACKAPHIPRVPTPPVATMPDRLFIRMLERMNGTPSEILDDPGFMQALLPTLRADFALVDSYEYADEPALQVPIRAFGGTHDSDVRENDLMAWQVQTTSGFALRMLSGGHFIVRARAREITAVIGAELAALTPAESPS